MRADADEHADIDSGASVGRRRAERREIAIAHLQSIETSGITWTWRPSTAG
jgi:hypothetical protein